LAKQKFNVVDGKKEIPGNKKICEAKERAGLKPFRYNGQNKFKGTGLKTGHYETVYEMATTIAG
jgi:hypothetical protein